MEGYYEVEDHHAEYWYEHHDPAEDPVYSGGVPDVDVVDHPNGSGHLHHAAFYPDLGGIRGGTVHSVLFPDFVLVT